MQCQTREGMQEEVYFTEIAGQMIHNCECSTVAVFAHFFIGSGSRLRLRFSIVRPARPNIAESRRLLRPNRPSAEAHFTETAP